MQLGVKVLAQDPNGEITLLTMGPEPATSRSQAQSHDLRAIHLPFVAS